jgi:EAL domain-containing protein (putative c-di-GMP-specific phosphodiesterase class I)
MIGRLFILSIHQIIQKEEFYHVFQPIFDLQNMEVIGYEGLLRNNLYSNPEVIFQAAMEERQLFELDSRSIQKAVRTYSKGSGIKGYLFLNVYPSTILNPSFLIFLNNIMLEKEKYSQLVNISYEIVLEIIESEEIFNFNFMDFKDKIRQIKEYGLLIAIDDFGKGFDRFSLLIELESDFLKLDHYFAKDLFNSKQKQLAISLILDYCSNSSCSLILEGIESKLDLVAAKAINIPFAQGFLLGKPGLL